MNTLKITIEGPAGAGKSTLAGILANWLKLNLHPVTVYDEGLDSDPRHCVMSEQNIASFASGYVNSPKRNPIVIRVKEAS